jgi:hypothetical protein
MEYLWSLWSSLRPWIAWAWAWMKANHEPLTVVVTSLGVLVAWRYVVLTRRLAEAANVQARAGREQAEAGRITVQAAAEQARITRQIFEASHRPIVGLMTYEGNFFRGADSYRLHFEAKNHGQVPAILTESRMVARRGAEVLVERTEPGRGRCIFPGEDTRLECEQVRPHGGVAQTPREAVDVELTVHYTGFDDVVRTSRISVVGNFDGGWTRLLTEIQ